MRRWIGLAIALGAATLFARLAVWQLHRHAERAAFNAGLQARADLPPVPLADLLNRRLPQDSLELRAVTATGVFDFAHQIVEWPRSDRGTPGVYVATPLRLPDGRAILVIRGWAYSPDARTIDLSRLTEPDSQTVRGVLLTRFAGAVGTVPHDSTFPLYVRDAVPGALQSFFPYPLIDAELLRATAPESRYDRFLAAPLPPLDAGPHLWYAFQWFAFAAIALVGGAILFRREA